jgi:hypothetical protein
MTKIRVDKKTNRGKEEFNIKKCKITLNFECLGVKLGLRSNNSVLIKRLKARLPDILPIERRDIQESEAIHWFSIVKNSGAGKHYKIYKELEIISTDLLIGEILDVLESQIRITIAEFAENFVFLHAGVIGWRGMAIVIPGKSFSGKTTLVAELVKRNCDYLSDEYAVIDEKGFVHPFPKKLSLRGILDDYRQVDFDVEELGGARAQTPLPIGFLLITEYNKKIKKPNLKVQSPGEGLMASVANSISVRRTPKFVLKVLSSFINKVVILKTKRGDVAEFADLFLNYLEKMKNHPSK